MSISRKMDKGVVCIYNEIYSVIKKLNNATCSNIDGPRDYHTKRNKSKREIQIPYDITYMWNLKYDINELIHKTEIHSQTYRLVIAKVEAGGEG